MTNLTEYRGKWRGSAIAKYNYCVYMCVCVHAQLCPTFCDPVDYSSPVSSLHGIVQARILDWVTSSCSKGLPNPEIKPMSPEFPALAGRFFTTSTTWEAPERREKQWKTTKECQQVPHCKGERTWWDKNGH